MWQDLCALLQHPEPIAYALERAHGRHWLPQALQARQEALRKGRANLDTQMDRLTQAYLAAMIPLEEYQRRRRSLEERIQALETQMTQLEAQVDRRAEVVGLVSSIEAFCQRVQARLTNATFEHKRRWVELLIDRVIVTDEDVEIRYVIPTHPRSEHVRFCQLRKDYFDDIIQIFGLANDDCRPVRFVIALDGRSIRLTAVDRDRLGDTISAGRFLEKIQSRFLIPLLREQEVNGLTVFVHGAIQIAPLSFDPNIRFVHPPAQPHRPLAAVERRFELGSVLQHPAVNRGVVHRYPTFPHQFFDLAVA